jgi:lysophospholipase L1-like esterase
MANLSRTSKTLLYIAVMSLFIAIFVELGLRAYFALKVGPRILYYGTESHRNWVRDTQKKGRESWQDKHYVGRSVEIHRDSMAEYSKFFPNEKKLEQDFRTGETFEVRINNTGFRGPDFEQQKRADVRILTLGASSTFGFYDRDDETYPYYLQKTLDRSCPERTWEVINFGIPHLTSDMISALFIKEGIPLQPDFVTLYTGNNDSLMKPDAETMSLPSRIWAQFTERLLTFKYLDYAIETISPGKIEYDDQYANFRSAFFLDNLSVIYEGAQQNDIQLIVGTQQKRAKTTSGWLPDEAEVRELLAGVTYEEEVVKVREKQESGEVMSDNEVSLLIHNVLMQDLHEWTAEHSDARLVDMITVLNQHRHYLLTWVHLHPEANQMIADAWADTILRQACPSYAAALSGS